MKPMSYVNAGRQIETIAAELDLTVGWGGANMTIYDQNGRMLYNTSNPFELVGFLKGRLSAESEQAQLPAKVTVFCPICGEDWTKCPHSSGDVVLHINAKAKANAKAKEGEDDAEAAKV